MHVAWRLVGLGVTASLAACSFASLRFRPDEDAAEDCSTPGDEDGNGLADCADPACAALPACQQVCGNGIRDPGEQCDDGNAVDGDGCDTNCRIGLGGAEVLAGDPGLGYVDGPASSARFYRVTGVAVDAGGNIYVADQFNFAIRKISASGIVTTLAGHNAGGSNDGTGAAASFNGPTGVAVDGAGNVYVGEYYHTIRKITPAGVVSTLAGIAQMSGSADGTGTVARFYGPWGVAADRSGNVYVADRFNHTIRKVSPDGVVMTLAGTAGMSGSADGTGAAARFNHPAGVAVDDGGTLYVADSDNSTIRTITPDGVVTTLAGTAGIAGRADGMGPAAQFDSPEGVAVDSARTLYVADQGNFAIRRVTATGVVTTLAGGGTARFADGTGSAAGFDFPSGVAVDGAGNVYVADYLNYLIRKVTAGGAVTTIAGTVAVGSADGPGAAARFSFASGVAADSAGNLYIADRDNHTVRKLTAGVVTTVAGAPGMPGGADGTGAAARFFYPEGVALDAAGHVYVSDAFNHTIRVITADGVVTTLAGAAGMSGSADGSGAGARFFFPSGVAVDRTGKIYVADQFNHTIRAITVDGVVTTLAGTAGISGGADGTGGAAQFAHPSGVAVDGAGNVYVADRDNHTIRKITAAGVVTTLAGTAGMNGTVDDIGPAARFSNPTGITLDAAGNLYVADSFNTRIRKITPAGLTTTVPLAATFDGSRFGLLKGVAIIDDALVTTDGTTVLLLRHGVR